MGQPAFLSILCNPAPHNKLPWGIICLALDDERVSEACELTQLCWGPTNDGLLVCLPADQSFVVCKHGLLSVLRAAFRNWLFLNVMQLYSRTCKSVPWSIDNSTASSPEPLVSWLLHLSHERGHS